MLFSHITVGCTDLARDAGAPGPRPHYGEGYYGAYLRDPDGNKLHLARRGDLVEPGA